MSWFYKPYVQPDIPEILYLTMSIVYRICTIVQSDILGEFHI